MPKGVTGQTIDEHNWNDFYLRENLKNQKAHPLPYIREDDIVWELGVWRTIDLREKFNQFFYFPTEAKGVHGRKCLSRVIWDAVVSGAIPIYEDDEFKIPIDNEDYVARYTKSDTVILEIEDENENFEYKTILVPKEFRSEEILQIKLKEAWYIDKVTSRQHVWLIGLAICKDLYKEMDGERDYIGTADLFWVPFNSMEFRNLLIQNEAYYEGNLAHLPTWNHIFESRMWESFITREENVMNRTISSYLTGTDAIIESQNIEYKLLEISEDMWEY